MGNLQEDFQNTLKIQKKARKIAVSTDESLNYLYNKAEKITTAIYIITNFFSSKEPLKWQIREDCIHLTGSIATLSTSSLFDRSLKVNNVTSYLFQLKTLFNLAYNIGLVSQMNYEVISAEILDLLGFLSEYYQGQLLKTPRLFKGAFFKEDIPKGHNNVKDNTSYKGQSVLYKKTGYNRKKGGELNNRKKGILEVIKEKKVVSIKDLAISINDCSEKTLQREVLSMVYSGLIKKEGERRWSRYSINDM